MSSTSDYQHAESSRESSLTSLRQPSRRQSPTPLTPRKRRRLESIDSSRIHNSQLQAKYSDAYRILYNADVSRAAARFEPPDDFHCYSKQVGASTWTAQEQIAFFAALTRLGRDNVPGIAAAVATKTNSEIQQMLLLLHDAAVQTCDAKVTLRDIPAAIEIGNECNAQLDLAGEALAWYQDLFDASQEQDKFGDYWLVTPAVAARVEQAIAGDRARGSSSPPLPPPSEGSPMPQRGGRVIVGACASCKKLKQRCDRGSPCGNCVRRKIQPCTYQYEPTNSEADHQVSTYSNARSDLKPSILDAIPEAQLLHAQTMLTLSKTLFMNRSPSIPSPWPHWSAYRSELSEEPSMYRSAFNDLHNLVLSVTKRLVQTTIIQANSRLRSQRRRLKHGLSTFIKRRDALSAIDVLGMRRNGHERWRGVARRCAVRVYERNYKYKTSPKGRKDISWEEVERIMAPPMDRWGQSPMVDGQLAINDTSTFKSRAARSGTPLPMDQLALSDDDSVDSWHGSVISDTDSESLRHTEDDRLLTRTEGQSRDVLGRYASAPLAADHVASTTSLCTLVQFDEEASRQEEEALWQLLDMEPATKEGATKADRNSKRESVLEQEEKLITESAGWRSWTEYHAEWEEFDTPVPDTEFLQNQRPDEPMFMEHGSILHEKLRASSNNSDTPAGLHRPAQQTMAVAELRARSTRAYAALQEKSSHFNEMNNSLTHSLSVSDADADADADLPTQSIEDGYPTIHHASDEHKMDWKIS